VSTPKVGRTRKAKAERGICLLSHAIVHLTNPLREADGHPRNHLAIDILIRAARDLFPLQTRYTPLAWVCDKDKTAASVAIGAAIKQTA
jgi:hypothetical protein